MLCNSFLLRPHFHVCYRTYNFSRILTFTPHVPTWTVPSPCPHLSRCPSTIAGPNPNAGHLPLPEPALPTHAFPYLLLGQTEQTRVSCRYDGALPSDLGSLRVRLAKQSRGTGHLVWPPCPETLLAALSYRPGSRFQPSDGDAHVTRPVL